MRDVTRREFLGTAAALAVTGLVRPRRARAQALTTLTIGYLPLASFAPVYLADDLGLLRERGMALTYVRVASGRDVAALLASGDLDVAGGGVGASTFNAVARNIPVFLVADKGRYLPGVPSASKVMARTDLYERGIRSMREIKGLTFAISALGGVGHFHVTTMVQSVGLTEDDIRFVPMEFPAMVTAMRQKAIDVCEAPEPFGFRMEEEGIARQIADVADFLPQHQYAHMVYGERMRARRDLAQGFIDAYVLGIRRYYDLGPYHDTVVESLARHTRLPADVLRRIRPVWFDVNGDVLAEAIARVQAWFQQRGLVKEPVPMSRLIDMSFLGETWKRHGKVAEQPGRAYWDRVTAARR